MEKFSILLVILSSFLIAKGYLLVFLAAAMVFCVRIIVRRTIFLDYFAIALVLYSILLLFFYFREVSVGSDYSDYFLSSLAMALSYAMLLLSVRFSSTDLVLMLRCFQLVLVFQAIIIFMRFTGVYELPIPFGESESNFGFVSVQVREQLTSVSMCLQLAVMVCLSSTQKMRLYSCIIAVFSVPAVFLTGSTLGVGVFALGLLYLFFGGVRRLSFPLKCIVIFVGLFLATSLAPLVGDLITNQFQQSGSDKFEAVTVINQVQDSDLLYFKIFESNTRVKLLIHSILFSSQDLSNLFFGGARTYFLDNTGGLSPHSILSEVIASGGLLGLGLFTLFILGCYFMRRKELKITHFVFLIILLVLTGTINSINLGIPLLGLLAVLTRRSGSMYHRVRVNNMNNG